MVSQASPNGSSWVGSQSRRDHFFRGAGLGAAGFGVSGLAAAGLGAFGLVATGFFFSGIAVHPPSPFYRYNPTGHSLRNLIKESNNGKHYLFSYSRARLAHEASQARNSLALTKANARRQCMKRLTPLRRNMPIRRPEVVLKGAATHVAKINNNAHGVIQSVEYVIRSLDEAAAGLA
jgi:hypothetical protein